eukprot:683870-Pyramimonas_sp.AAC.1
MDGGPLQELHRWRSDGFKDEVSFEYRVHSFQQFETFSRVKCGSFQDAILALAPRACVLKGCNSFKDSHGRSPRSR